MHLSRRYAGKVEYAAARPMRVRNTRVYRLLHWPIWIGVFFLAPGPLTFRLFAEGFGRDNLLWLGVVLAATGTAGLRDVCPASNPSLTSSASTRRSRTRPTGACATPFAWNAALAFASLNLLGLLTAAVTGRWRMRPLYRGYPPLCAAVLMLGASGRLPRVGASTKGEGKERRWFYGTVWSVTAAQTVLLLLWKTRRQTRETDLLKLGAFAGTLGLMGLSARSGALPRTRLILPGEQVMAD